MPEDDAESMANVVVKLLLNKKLYDDVSNNARISAEKRFSLRKHVNQVQHLYDELIQN